MKQEKLVDNLKDALRQCDLRDGMTVSFHHHLRNGDYVLNLTLAALAEMGLRDLNVNASSLFDVHRPLLPLIERGVVSSLSCNYMSAEIGRAVSGGLLGQPVTFRTHGGRAADILSGESPIDLAVIAAPSADPQGNLSGKYGPSACGSLGYAMPDAAAAARVIAVTDHLLPYPLADFSIPETQVDFVVKVDKIGDPRGIVSGTTQITRDPIGLLMAEYATQAIQASGLLQDGFSFQTGAGGASLAAAKFLKDVMLREKIKGSFGLGGITSYLVEMMQAGCFETLMDVQCFDLEAVRSIRENPAHREVSADHYASPQAKSALVDSLDVVILGATQVDLDFNVNVHTDSNGFIMGGSGGHSDTAAGAKLAMIIAPLIRARLPLIVDRVHTISTPGDTIDLIVTQYGLAVNPRRPDLYAALKDARLPLFDLTDLKNKAEKLTGTPLQPMRSDKIVGEVRYRTGEIIDRIHAVL